MSETLPQMTPAQEEAWLALLDLQARKPTGWTLVGGQMVHLHCAERGVAPARPTDDVDTVVDVRAEPQALYAFTRELAAMGFEPGGFTPEGHQHRWIKGSASIDVLVPRGLGARADSRKGYGGGTTLATPGAQQALNRTEDVRVVVAGQPGTVRRPNLLGALVSKAAAHTVPVDPGRDRHLTDFALLATLIRPADRISEATARDRQYLRRAITALEDRRRLLAQVEGADQGIARLRLALTVTR